MLTESSSQPSPMEPGLMPTLSQLITVGCQLQHNLTHLLVSTTPLSLFQGFLSAIVTVTVILGDVSVKIKILKTFSRFVIILIHKISHHSGSNPSFYFFMITIKK